MPKDLWPVKALIGWGIDTSIYRDMVYKYWGAYPYEFHACTEAGIIAAQSLARRDMTFIPHSNFFEFIPEAEWLRSKEDIFYEPRAVLLPEVKSGECYELVVTSFYGMPFIRYRLGHLIRIIGLEDEEAKVCLPQMVFEARADDLIDIAGFTRVSEKTVMQAIANTGIDYEDWMVRKEISENKVTMFAGVPPMYAVLANTRIPEECDLSSWHLAISGGAALPVEVMKAFEKKYGIPIYEGDIDNIWGVFHFKDLPAWRDHDIEGLTVEQFVQMRDKMAAPPAFRLVRPVFLVPQSQWIDVLLTQMRQRGAHLAILLDEYGGTAGLLALEEILSEIVGEAIDKGGEGPAAERLDREGLRVPGRSRVRELNRRFDLDIPLGDSDTVGGYVMSLFGDVPEVGERIDNGKLEFTVVKLSGRSVDAVLIRRLPPRAITADS